MKIDQIRFPNSLFFRPLLMLFLLMMITTGTAFSQSAPQLGKDAIKEVIGAMTLQEKADLVVGMGAQLPPDAPDSVRRKMQVPAAEKYPLKVIGAAGWTHPIPRLGIPSMVLSDGPAGVRIQPIRNHDSTQTYYATAFPVARLLASSWDTSLVDKVGRAYGEEAREYGVDIALAPALNIQRNPLNGRNFEYYSEDPLIAGTMAGAMVRGIQSQGVGTSIKHFVANNQEASRGQIDETISPRALREIYLKGFRIAVQQGHPWTVMSSYNKVNGVYTSQRHDLITTIMRNEWGFNGLVMTDWFGGDDAVQQMKAGNDLIMPGSSSKIQRIVQAVHQHKLDESVLDRNVGHILGVIRQSLAFKGYDYSNHPDLKAHGKVARRAAAQSMILLKNDDYTLPLNKKQTAVLFGNTSYDIIIGGRGSGAVNQAYTVQLSRGLKDDGLAVDGRMKDQYEHYIRQAKAKQPKLKGFFDHHKPIPEMPINAAKAREEAKNNDVAVITIGKNSGEGSDRDKSDFYLNTKDEKLIKTVSSAFHAEHKKVIVILNIAGVTDVASWKKQADAILLAWQPGQEAGHALADILSGQVNPSGKLTTTFPVKYSDVPSSDHFPGTPAKKPKHVTYKEGIFTGYRYYDTFNVKPVYSFGYGLSYTKFSFDNMKLSSSTFHKNLKVTIDISNAGKLAGKEVVQLYIHAPAKSEDKPVRELKGFAKTKRLKPGETQTITFRITPANLASFETKISSWEATAGSYKVEIGASSRDIRQSHSFKLPQTLTVEKVHRVLQPKKEIKELTPVK